jgi:predicted nucleotidyltransferase
MGVMAIDERLAQAIVQRILSVAKPDRIILFGSAATGHMTQDSDIDLLVVAPSPSNTLEERVRLRRSLRGLGFPFDVFIIATERFEESKNIFGGIAYPAHKYGRVIYEAA